MPDRRRFQLQLMALAAAGTGLSRAAHAQAGDFPSRPVRLIVPFAAGGGPDLLARAMAVRLAPALGKGAVVFVENIVGAGGIVAAQNVARMAPDGYNLLTGASSHMVQKAMQPSVKFDPQKDFAPISRIGLAPSILVVAADAPYRSVEDLIAAARKNPGTLNYASGGVGSAAHLCGAALAVHSHIDVVHVPYKGSVEIVPAILTGSVHFAFPIASTAAAHVQSGKVRALAVTGAKRLAAFPLAPTLLELLGASDLVLDAWFGLWAPAGTPVAIVQTLFKALHRAFEDPALRKEIEDTGTAVGLSASPQEFTGFMQAEAAKFERLVKAAQAGIQR
ncbi:Bug family tripartite tricarboxylate transporter substrate binding protein [Verminephrobacter eiseniae]|uniref:Bug family tripartite tricarboxylate transporter substrate binding protein n=1 Tax=Verminephrobacter eiseniae TaxID=364317 RepID=UPI002237043B|nr:tripartite tricarboxylate transporter substrate-binding protein [Verminephrobacter eiseniae]MCW5234986.1 tripartite tricarboxylate transporter substrate binding protein [Verminephrobacter eiseniae]